MTNAAGKAFVVAMTASLIGLGLAVMLLIAGILALTGRRAARRLHLIYSALKIPTTIAACLAYQMVVNDLMQAVTPAPAGIFSTQIAILAVAGCIYPLALLIVMNTQAVKNYYASITVK